MCGIAGFIDDQHQHQDRASEIMMTMLHDQVHRGPDAEGCFVSTIGNRQVVLGHRRLSILDVRESANQPMQFDHLSIVFNGEVYNFKDIRSSLIKHGYQFNTNGDTEVILKAFHRDGIKCLSQFRGMFSFCIVDHRQQKAYLVRDRAGTKPLYYYHDHERFIFSSEIRSFRAHPKVKQSLCANGLSLYFQYGYIPSPWTIYTNTKKIRPGHYLEIDINENAYHEINYWDLADYYDQLKLTLTEEEAINQCEALLNESFALRMISDVPVGVLLSGGIDSSLVASILQKNSNQQLDTFTIAFKHDFYDESKYARQIANYLGTNHHEKLCTASDAFNIIQHLPEMYGEPMADSSAIPTALISQFAKQKVSVVLSGDGGDELFCGYSAYPLNEHRFAKINKIPFKAALGSFLSYLPSPVIGLYRLNYDLYNRYLKFKSILSLNDLEANYAAIIKTFTPYDVNKLLIHQQKAIPFLLPIQHNLPALERMMLFDFKQYLADDLMVKVDRATMFYSLEGREPLLDHKLLEFAARLPLQYKMQKRILKQVLARYLPSTYFERQKHGFGMPINQWLRHELNPLLRQYLDPIKLKQQGIFNERYVNGLYRAFMKSNTNDSRIWTLLVFQLWYAKYFNETF